MIRFLRMFKRKAADEIPSKTPDDDAADPIPDDCDDYVLGIDDRYLSGSYCVTCAHFYVNTMFSCVAFPEHIPLEVWNGERPHLTPYPGDNGIQFEPRNGDPNEFERYEAYSAKIVEYLEKKTRKRR